VKTIEQGRLRPKEAAQYIGVSLSAMAKWRIRGEGPPFHRLGPRLVVYFKDEIDAWIARRVSVPLTPRHHVNRTSRLARRDSR
jgi:predicted DNA-binding transcriptional regulator AlpA